MFKQLASHPAYILKFAIYILFIAFAAIFYFSNTLAIQDKNMKIISSLLLLFYGSYRMLRTYQDFKAEIRDEQRQD